MDDEEGEFAISYMGVQLGVPVLTRDRHQFGILEHVLAVDEEDIFEGIVVWTGQGSWADRKIQHELSQGHAAAAQKLEAFRGHELRFVMADKIAAITQGYVRCDLDLPEVALLQPPQVQRGLEMHGNQISGTRRDMNQLYRAMHPQPRRSPPIIPR